MLTQLFGGSYMPTRHRAHAFSINPFSLPPSEENLHFLFSFVKVLIESSGHLTGWPTRTSANCTPRSRACTTSILRSAD